ncbi:MAG: energy-coupling factor ABC transporter substrate-binding protein [ANME-2 cluster archaeon]|nr:energy-coupling factor ABC transporter substrate-binding protein [ANME-2 cluster archaeon]
MKLELIVSVIVLLFIALFLYISSTTNAEFGGADTQVGGVIEELTDGTYEPTAKPFWKPPSSEIESLLFALQAALGALVIGYFFGYYRGKNQPARSSQTIQSVHSDTLKPGN